ncbi:MAG TPA: hypothetical protein PK264_19810, partial [Hyphomicrobiaceae bacterium]|nr:hypothetical protein [Hyphomicrobiaceae bacterium]
MATDGTPVTRAGPAATASANDRGARNPARRVPRSVVLVASALATGLLFGMVALNRPMGVPTAVMERDVAIRVFGLGTVEARVQSKIGFEVGATLTELAVDHGDRVTDPHHAGGGRDHRMTVLSHRQP